MNFNVGDKVVCIIPNHIGWSDEDGNNVISPKYDEVLVIDFIHKEPNRLYLGFNKYNSEEGYNSKGFRKLDYDFVEKVLRASIEAIADNILQTHSD